MNKKEMRHFTYNKCFVPLQFLKLEKNRKKMKILITGASGFIGSFIVEKALSSGYEVWAGIRTTSNRHWLTDERIHFIYLDFQDSEALHRELERFRRKEGRWDYVVHAAGATKARSEADFFQVNYEGTRLLVNTLKELDMVPERFLFMSSFSVMGAPKEKPAPTTDGCIYPPITSADEPHPNTAYGRSKLAAELFLHSEPDFPVIVLRPTGVYGPRERDYFMLAQSIARHIDFAVGFRPQEITFIYVRDLADAVFLALEKGKTGQSYFLSDGNTYNSRTFSLLLQQELMVKRVVHIKAPLWLLRAVCGVSQAFSNITGRMTALNNDKYHILKQRNWRCDISEALALGYRPKYNLEAGVKETIAWYKNQKWI